MNVRRAITFRGHNPINAHRIPPEHARRNSLKGEKGDESGE